MIRRLIAFLWLLLIGQQGFGQAYIPMLGQSNTWKVVSCFGGCIVSSYGTSRDTTIDGNDYRILDGYHYIQGNFLIREDISERKVYMKILAAHVLLDEFPLYDFSLQEGDTTHVYNPISPLPDDGGLFVLDSIVSRPLETGHHRFFYLHAVNPVLSASERTVWVEGVGALSLLNSPGGLSTEENHLGCSFVNGINRYAHLDSIGSCELLNGIKEIKPSSLMLMPSVFKDEVQINVGDFFQSGQLKVYSINGVLVYSSSVSRKSVLRIDSDVLPKGMLLFVLIDKIGNAYSAKGINLGE